MNVTHKSSALASRSHQNLKPQTWSESLRPNASNCAEETEVFLLLLAVINQAGSGSTVSRSGVDPAGRIKSLCIWPGFGQIQHFRIRPDLKILYPVHPQFAAHTHLNVYIEHTFSAVYIGINWYIPTLCFYLTATVHTAMCITEFKLRLDTQRVFPGN